MLKKNNKISNFFNIKKTIFEKQKDNYNIELFFEEHFEEIRQRFFQSFFLICFFTVIVFFNVNIIVNLLETPVSSLKFFQLSPGEFFISTIEISLFFSLLISSPLFLNQLIFFLLPGLNDREKNVILYLTIGSVTLFFLGLLFSYFILIPTTLGFFINYGKDNIEPLLSFNQYISFIGVLFFSTGLLFQIPIIQILFCLLNIFSGRKMLKIWRYIVLGSTIISAIFTPSADPVTQILLAVVLIGLYFLGAFASIFLKPI
jgi:sec-independent protein translocase protein TatC